MLYLTRPADEGGELGEAPLDHTRFSSSLVSSADKYTASANDSPDVSDDAIRAKEDAAAAKL